MNVEDPRKYYNEECYALTNCMHCPDCLAFAHKYFKDIEQDSKVRQRGLVVKFILATISAENLPCRKALTAENLRKYISDLLEGKQELPICHYEFDKT